jgi:hypothetical protein
MIITITNTDKVVVIDGVETRLWEGTTSDGCPVHCFMHRISPRTHDKEQLKEFDDELIEKPQAIFMDFIEKFIVEKLTKSELLKK